jgi:hypothetical protein
MEITGMNIDLAQATADRRSGSGGDYRSQFSVGGVSVQLSGHDSAAVALVPSLAPFRGEAPVSDIDIQVEWTRELNLPTGSPLFDSAAVWRLYGSEAGFQFDFTAPVFGEHPYKRLLVDGNFSWATLKMRRDVSAGFPFAAPLDYPLDELLIMHRLTQEKAIELHGVGIVGPDGASNLFVGHSGAGKSTTARLWSSLHKVEILSDDRIIVREHRSANDSTQIFMYGTPWHGEAAFALPQRAPLQRIFVLEHGHGNLLTRLTPSQVVAELFARAFVPFHRHEYVDSALSFLQRVADSIPCYRYSFEPDERAVGRILYFND